MIACVEDDQSILEIEMYTLRSTGFEAEGFKDGKTFFEALKEEKPELVILDIMLPDMSGSEILKKLKQDSSAKSIPVIMASAKGTEYDKIRELDAGADDYLAKPFGMMEMVSRVKAVLRRAGKKETVIAAGKIRILPDRHEVFANEQPVELTLKEYEILLLLAKHPGMVFTREQLLNQVWGLEYDGETRTVDVHIRTLRQKLGDESEAVETVRGVGYRFQENKK